MSSFNHDADLSGGLGDDGGFSQPARSSVLSNRLSSILSASFSDAELRDALRGLDEKKVRNTPETRRQLRLDVQKEVIDCNAEIIHDFGQVAEQLKRVGATIASLNRSYEDLRRHVTASQSDCGPVTEEATALLQKKNEVDRKESILGAFKKHFLVADDELLALTSASMPVDERYFALLARLKTIHRECQVLLGSDTPQLGLELMETSSRQLNSAFQKLYRWIQKEFKTLDLENPQMNTWIRRALRVLAERPALFHSCLDFFAESREHNLSDAFYTALTGHSDTHPGHQTSKPMDFYAHDALRFVGDMLAWTHSATVSEREALEVLFVSEGGEMAKGIQAGRESEPWLHGDVAVFDGQQALEQLVSRDLAGVARALRQRVEQVIRSDEDPVLAYKLANLIHFYSITFARLLGSTSSVLATLRELRESALRQYRSTMKELATSIPGDMVPPPPDLSIPEFLADALKRLRDIMASFDASLTPVESRQTAFAPFITESLDPFLDLCQQMATQLEEPAKTIFSINCALAAPSILSAFSFTEERIAAMDDRLRDYTSTLIDDQHAFFLHTSGLHPLLAALAPLTDSTEDVAKLRTLPPFQPRALSEASQRLDDFLPSALMDATERLQPLKHSGMVDGLTAEAADQFCEDFEFVESRIAAADELLDSSEDAAEAGEVVPLRSVFPRTSAEIRVLLG